MSWALKKLVRNPPKIRLKPSRNSSGDLGKFVRNLSKIRPKPSKKSSESLNKFVRSPPTTRSNPNFGHILAAKDSKQQGLLDFSVLGATIFLLHFLIQYVRLLLHFVIFEKNGKLGCHG